MPRFYEHPSVKVGEEGGYYELDGELLRAVLIAAHDFLPPRAHGIPCGSKLEAQRYHVNRRGNIIFVYIYEDEEYCGGGFVALDSGAKYAIGTDGRILRRVFDGQPEGPFEGVSPDGGPQGVPAKPGVVPGYEPVERELDGGSSASPSLPLERRDEGSSLEVQDGGTSSAGSMPLLAPLSAPDGGTPSVSGNAATRMNSAED
ncbi:hypothetical protein F0U60_00895 [Archangium minus]|uniref:Uncharacterized protein n=1 Tax=Archangium minus TaxID=83450 RepID=A0ABY9WGW7_9BACT|nr:hypothetical protein F0U60_00895 [Archangium minus]